MSGPIISWSPISDSYNTSAQYVNDGRYKLLSPSSIVGTPTLALQNAFQACTVKTYLGSPSVLNTTLTIPVSGAKAILHSSGRALTVAELQTLVIEAEGVELNETLYATDEPNGSLTNPFPTEAARNAAYASQLPEIGTIAWYMDGIYPEKSEHVGYGVWKDVSRKHLKFKEFTRPLISFYGDSITVGIGTALNPAITGGWIWRAAAMLNAANDYRISPLTLEPAKMNNSGLWTAAAAWTAQAFGAGSDGCLRSQAAGTLVYTPPAGTPVFNQFRLMVIGIGVAGTLTLTPSVGSPLVVDLSVLPLSPQIVTIPLSVPSATATLTIELTAGGNAYVCGAGTEDTRVNSIQWAINGVSGSKAYGGWDNAGGNKGLDYIGSVRAQKSIIMLGRNDLLNGTSVANIKAALTTIARKAAGYGSVALASIPPSSEATGLAYDAALRDATKEVCVAGGYEYIPMSETVFGNVYVPAMMNGPYHPNDVGEVAMANFFVDWWNS